MPPNVHTDFMLVVGGAALPTKAGSVALLMIPA